VARVNVEQVPEIAEESPEKEILSDEGEIEKNDFLKDEENNLEQI